MSIPKSSPGCCRALSNDDLLLLSDDLALRPGEEFASGWRRSGDGTACGDDSLRGDGPTRGDGSPRGDGALRGDSALRGDGTPRGSGCGNCLR